MGKAVVRASEDRAVPAEFVGKIEPNYFCRGWNKKRQKYCSARAGFRTSHPGRGRCWRHGGQQEGDKRVKHGRFATVQTKEIRQLMEQIADNADPLDVIEELLIAKAYLRQSTSLPFDLATADKISEQAERIGKIVHRIELARAAYAVSRPELLRIMTEMGRQVEAYVTELGRALSADRDLDPNTEVDATLKRIRDGWISVRL